MFLIIAEAIAIYLYLTLVFDRAPEAARLLLTGKLSGLFLGGFLGARPFGSVGVARRRRVFARGGLPHAAPDSRGGDQKSLDGAHAVQGAAGILIVKERGC